MYPSRRQALLTPFALACAGRLRAAGSEAYRWRNVALGGGGYVTGMAIHPIERDLIYIRTDVGGPYRWDPAADRWIPLFDFWTPANRNFVGIDAMALDSNDPNRIWVAAGQYDYATPSDVMLSRDRGGTWERMNVNVRMGGNQSGRMAGERLAVDPTDSNRVFFGSRYDGLLRTVDGGKSWQPVEAVPKGTPGTGVVFVLCSPAGWTAAGVAGGGVWCSYDGGVTWSLLDYGPALNLVPRRAAYTRDDALVVTYRAESGNNGAVWRADARGWTDITPERGRNYLAITTDPTDAGTMIAVENRDGFDCRIYLSRDGGASWSRPQTQAAPDVPWWPSQWWASALSSITFDPHRPGRVWYTDWYGTWRTDDIRDSPQRWYTRESGHETIVSFALLSLPSGNAPLLSGSADIDGMRHEDLQAFPPSKYGTPPLQDTTSLDYCEKSPNVIVRVGGRRDNPTPAGAVSRDYGATWETFATLPVPNARNGRVAMSAEDPNLIVWIPMGLAPWRSKDGGKTWEASTGAPTGAITGSQVWAWNQPLAADRVDGNRFYLYRSGTVYISTDGGLTWSTLGTLGNNGNQHVRTAPGRRGEVWVSLDTAGLHRWNSDGARFERVPGITRAAMFDFGIGRSGWSTPALYVYGALDGREGMYRSDDLGASWLEITSREFGLATANTIAADRQKFGRVYIGTNGRGIFYGEPSGS